MLTSGECWGNDIRVIRRNTTAFLKVPIYRIVSIATLNAKREDGGGPWTVSQIGSRSVGEKTEAEILAKDI
jgi:hypothetical protein